MPLILDPIKPLQLRRSVRQTLWWTWLISSILLIVVSGLLIWRPSVAQQLWPWPLAPFNTKFFGIVYLSVAIPLICYVIRPENNRLKLILPLFTCFTTYFFLVSIFHHASFLDRRSSDIWFFLYGADSFIGLLCLWQSREYIWNITPTQSRWLGLYLIQAIILGSYALGNLLLPQPFGQFWFWPLDVFHAHLYSGVFLSGSLAMILLRQSSRRLSRIVLAVVQSSFGLGVALSTGLLDRRLQKLDWSTFHPWFWQLTFILFGVVGLAMLYLEIKACPLEPQA